MQTKARLGSILILCGPGGTGPEPSPAQSLEAEEVPGQSWFLGPPAQHTILKKRILWPIFIARSRVGTSLDGSSTGTSCSMYGSAHTSVCVITLAVNTNQNAVLFSPLCIATKRARSPGPGIPAAIFPSDSPSWGGTRHACYPCNAATIALRFSRT